MDQKKKIKPETGRNETQDTNRKQPFSINRILDRDERVGKRQQERLFVGKETGPMQFVVSCASWKHELYRIWCILFRIKERKNMKMFKDSGNNH